MGEALAYYAFPEEHWRRMWSTKRYLNIELLKDQQRRGAITA